MINLSAADNQILCVTNFQDPVSTPFHGEMNAICRTRELTGDFSEIVRKIKLIENMATVEKKNFVNFSYPISVVISFEIRKKLNRKVINRSCLITFTTQSNFKMSSFFTNKLDKHAIFALQ